MIIAGIAPSVKADQFTKFFLNPVAGHKMNQDIDSANPPEGIHDGTDLSLYTASSISGSKFTFNSDKEAYGGIITIVNYANIDSGSDSVRVEGDSITNTTLIEGSGWVASASNDTTATSLASALNGVSGITASASGAVITVIADVGSNITELSTIATSGELTASALSVRTDNASVGDVMQFAKGFNLTLADFTALTMHIYVDKDWKAGDSIDLYAYDTDTSAEVGDRIQLEDYFSWNDHDEWHTISIPLADLSIASVTTVDAFRIELMTKEGKSPKYYIDKFQIEKVTTPSVPILFSMDVEVGHRFHINELIFTYAHADTSAIDFDRILGLPKLANGLVLNRKRGSETIFNVTLQTLGQHLALGGRIDETLVGVSGTFIVISEKFRQPLILTGNTDDVLTIQINDNMADLLHFTVVARGTLET